MVSGDSALFLRFQMFAFKVSYGPFSIPRNWNSIFSAFSLDNIAFLSYN